MQLLSRIKKQTIKCQKKHKKKKRKKRAKRTIKWKWKNRINRKRKDRKKIQIAKKSNSKLRGSSNIRKNWTLRNQSPRNRKERQKGRRNVGLKTHNLRPTLTLKTYYHQLSMFYQGSNSQKIYLIKSINTVKTKTKLTKARQHCNKQMRKRVFFQFFYVRN